MRLIKFLFPLAALVACLQPATTYALSFNEGQVLSHALLVCIKKADAIEIANTDSTKGVDAAGALWNTKDECAGVPVSGPTVGKVVHSVPVERDGEKLTMRVVEIIVNGQPVAYFLTTVSIGAKKAEVGGVPGTDQRS